jgi:glutaredoxin-related protein
MYLISCMCGIKFLFICHTIFTLFSCGSNEINVVSNDDIRAPSHNRSDWRAGKQLVKYVYILFIGGEMEM